MSDIDLSISPFKIISENCSFPSDTHVYFQLQKSSKYFNENLTFFRENQIISPNLNFVIPMGQSGREGIMVVDENDYSTNIFLFNGILDEEENDL